MIDLLGNSCSSSIKSLYYESSDGADLYRQYQEALSDKLYYKLEYHSQLDDSALWNLQTSIRCHTHQSLPQRKMHNTVRWL